ncbi:MAG TPA: phenylacetate-CoA oxygenase subunit PaaC [Saprospiraceae bacterium]|nr:phenylacetate-CoA oxygenase subunit PaaC [Saprospiraceae bacterium]
MNEALIKYLLSLGDTSLILGQRLGEWCGHGPVLEQDIAMTNISLDYIGRARLFYQYVCELQNDGQNEDQIAFMREEEDYLNLLLAEYPNKDFAYTIARQFFLDSYFVPLFEKLSSSSDERLSQIAAKSLKESHYHFRWSSEWMVRLGDGTEESNRRIQEAVQHLWEYTGEMFQYASYENDLTQQSLIPAAEILKEAWAFHIQRVFSESRINRPSDGWWQTGGKSGRHSEHLGYILSDMQYMQRVHPGLDW